MRRTDVIVLQIAFSTCHENGWFVCLSRHRSLGKTGFEGLESWSGGRSEVVEPVMAIRVKHICFICLAEPCMFGSQNQIPHLCWQLPQLHERYNDFPQVIQMAARTFRGLWSYTSRNITWFTWKWRKWTPPGRGDEPNLQIIQFRG